MKIEHVALYVQDFGCGPRTTGDGCYESCVIGPEGNLVEITV